MNRNEFWYKLEMHTTTDEFSGDSEVKTNIQELAGEIFDELESLRKTVEHFKTRNCSNCRHFVTRYSTNGKVAYHICRMEVRDVGPNFGCNRHEPKEHK